MDCGVYMQQDDEVMRITDVCPMCKKINKNTWVIAKVGEKTLKICKQCHADVLNPPLTSDFYDKAKKRVETERKQKNLQVLRDYRIKK